jgi:hypothetical protein
MSGVAWAGASLLQSTAVTRPRQTTTSVVVETFGGWADSLWIASRSQHALVGFRDAVTLNALYPPASQRFIRLQVRHAGQPIGWAVLLDTRMSDHPYFGTLRVGSIVDCMAGAQWAHAVVAQAVTTLRERGVDLIVSNQSARCWRKALRAEGFLERTSGFLFGASRALASRLSLTENSLPQFHLTRGDGDGPINL